MIFLFLWIRLIESCQILLTKCLPGIQTMDMTQTLSSTSCFYTVVQVNWTTTQSTLTGDSHSTMLLLPLSSLLLKNTSSQANILSSKIVKKNRHSSRISLIPSGISSLPTYQTSLALIELSTNLLPWSKLLGKKIRKSSTSQGTPRAGGTKAAVET